LDHRALEDLIGTGGNSDQRPDRGWKPLLRRPGV